MCKVSPLYCSNCGTTTWWIWLRCSGGRRGCTWSLSLWTTQFWTSWRSVPMVWTKTQCEESCGRSWRGQSSAIYTMQVHLLTFSLWFYLSLLFLKALVKFDFYPITEAAFWMNRFSQQCKFYFFKKYFFPQNHKLIQKLKFDLCKHVLSLWSWGQIWSLLWNLTNTRKREAAL